MGCSQGKGGPPGIKTPKETAGSGQTKEQTGAPRTIDEDESLDPKEAEARRKKQRDRECTLSARSDARAVPAEIYSQYGQEGRPRNAGSIIEPNTDFNAARTSLSFAAANTCASQAMFAERDQTIIIFDWDDTLCPSTFLRAHMQYDARGRLAVRLDEKVRIEIGLLAERALTLLQCAQALGKVIIVTNAKRPWVQVSCREFLPALNSTLRDIDVIYAPETVKGESWEGFTGCRLTEAKANAMKTVVTDFYSRYPNQSWKNIVSLGDAFFEHTAIRQVVNARPSATQKRRCRTKTIKLLEHPTVAGMIVQLSIVSGWLFKIVQTDDDVDIDLGADAGTVDKWSLQFGNNEGDPADGKASS
jgi:hypothetical protein